MSKSIPAILQNKKKLKVKKQKEELTQADLQRLKVLVQEQLTSYQELSGKVKGSISRAWELSDKSKQDGYIWFTTLNDWKNYMRQINTKVKNLEQTQKRIKSMLSS